MSVSDLACERKGAYQWDILRHPVIDDRKIGAGVVIGVQGERAHDKHRRKLVVLVDGQARVLGSECAVGEYHPKEERTLVIVVVGSSRDHRSLDRG